MKALLPLSILALTSAGLVACVSSGSGDSGDSTTTTGSTSDTSATSSTSTATSSGGASSTADSSTSTTGSGGSGDCASPVVMTTPLIADFEDYDGATAGIDWTWSFNEDGLGFAGFWLHTDEVDDSGVQAADGEYTLNFIAGADGSTYAISGQDPSADAWGGGVAMYTSCLDATNYTGIQFMIKGSDPAGTFDLSITTDGDQSFNSGDLDFSEDWTQVQVAFSSMMPADENTVTSTNGNGIIAIVFSSHLIWMQDPNATDGSWIPEPGPIEITVDDISLY